VIDLFLVSCRNNKASGDSYVLNSIKNMIQYQRSNSYKTSIPLPQHCLSIVLLKEG
jgi:hypothetical protein